MYPHFSVIINPVSGNNKGQEYLPLIQEYTLKHKGRLFVTTKPGHATSLAKKAVQSGDTLIFAAGGDDTVRETLEGIFPGKATLGVIPLGTFNNIALSLNIPSSPMDAFSQALEQGKDKAIDVGKVEKGPFFIESIGAGFDAFAWQKAPKEEAKSLRRWTVGLRTVWSALKDYKPQNMDITIDGKQRTMNNIMQITVANSATFASRIPIAPKAKVDDGLLDICIISNMSKLRFCLLAPLIFYWKLFEKFAHVTYCRGRKIRIYSKEDLPVRVDGMILRTLPIKLQVMSKALKVRLP